MNTDPVIKVKDLSMGYSGRVVMEHLDFEVRTGEIFCIMGSSGCGKSTLLKHITGLYQPLAGDIELFGRSIVNADSGEKRAIMRGFGVTYQGGALFGWMTVGENIAMPLREYSAMSEAEIAEVIRQKLELVGLAGFAGFMPSELSGGMRKRAAIARAMAMEPKLLFFDEPSAGLDPVTSAGLDRLILDLRDRLGTTVAVVTHELDSVFAIADRVIMLDREKKTAAAIGDPRSLRDECDIQWVRNFLNRNGLRRDAQNGGI